MQEIDLNRLTVANEVLQTFSVARIANRKNGFYVVWQSGDKTISKRWQTRGQDFYPTWSQQYPGGGTSCTALSQLIRWLRNQPVLPIMTWRWWASDSVKLIRDPSAIDTLLEAGYPEHADCVLCGNRIERGMDWWNLNGVSGPCCGHTTGCRQKPN